MAQIHIPKDPSSQIAVAFTYAPSFVNEGQNIFHIGIAVFHYIFKIVPYYKVIAGMNDYPIYHYQMVWISGQARQSALSIYLDKGKFTDFGVI